jgi:hypothetical protein
MSTLAISYTQVSLDESWGAEYTVNYQDAELSLSGPETTINNATSVTVVMSASHSPATIKSQILVEAQDINTDPITVDATGATIKVIFEDTVGGTSQKIVKSVGASSDFSGTLAMTSAQAVDQVTIIWTKQDGFTNAYQYGSFTVTDIA